MNQTTLAIKSFNLADQERFAAFSGDYNPMHLDAIQARRTRAGAPVVHGIHLLLWALDAFAAMYRDLQNMRSLRARFIKFVYLEDRVEAVLIQCGPTSASLNVCFAGAPMAQFAIDFGDPMLDSCELLAHPAKLIPRPPKALNITFEQIPGRSGRVAFASEPTLAASLFPAAAEWLGARRIAALAASTNLVGMICPGLHALFVGLSVNACTESDPQDVLAFRVANANARLRWVRHEIAGGGLSGNLECLVRMPPVSQATMRSLVGLIKPTEFAGSTALVVGGSRGLGELTAKMVATGGGRVILTYQAGRDDAERVAQEICDAGGAAETLPYDARKPAEEQLATLIDAPTHAYYFATPVIFRHPTDVFVSSRFKDFQAIYVDGFWDLAKALRARQPGLSIFYPSSFFVSERPQNMTEYSMAKSAGELLCADMNSFLKTLHVTVRRLPRLPTDQAVSLIALETASPIETMLPIVREVQSWPR
jgi:hypothetical protein